MKVSDVLGVLNELDIDSLEPDFSAFYSDCNYYSPERDKWLSLTDCSKAVYVFYDIALDSAIYVGKVATDTPSAQYNFCTRMHQHYSKSHCYALKDALHDRPDEIVLEVYKTDSIKDASLLELLLIWKLEPLYNKEGLKSVEGKGKEKKHTDSIKEELFKDIDAGMSKAQASRKHSISINTVYRYLKERTA